MKQKKVLVTPLDWGLGHATRCVPVIRELQRQGCEVFIAGSGDSLELMRKEFSTLQFFQLPGYAPKYPSNGSMIFHMAMQLPHFTRVISTEHDMVEDITRREGIDVIISDNRYGCWSPTIPSALITHQSNILMPKRFGWLRPFVRKRTEQMMNRFSACWIPDFPSSDSLAGDLVNFGKMNVTTLVEHIGWLSRFEKAKDDDQSNRFDIVAILSGPEPQRTLLENILVPQLRRSGFTYRVVRGLPAAAGSVTDDTIVDFMTSSELKACFQSSGLVIARSGYSTVMDMCALEKKAVMIPTPGQTEQEYLAKRLMQRRIAFSMPQDQFDLSIAVEESKKYSGFPPFPKNSLLRDAIAKLIK